MRGASLDGMRVATPATAGQVDELVGEWIGMPASAGQLAYYSAPSLRRERLHHRAEPLGLACIVPGVAISVVLALFAGSFDAHLKHVLVSVMGILSVAAAVHEAYVHKKADRELVRQYRFMRRIFASAKRLLDGTGDLEEKRRILVALGEAALTEHAGWTLMHRERPLPHSRIWGRIGAPARSPGLLARLLFRLVQAGEYPGRAQHLDAPSRLAEGLEVVRDAFAGQRVAGLGTFAGRLAVRGRGLDRLSRRHLGTSPFQYRVKGMPRSRWSW